ncbi:hypothetical protein AMS68_006146 [Peltaster fructicola]|uniref:Chromatin modification-related protein EAF7 n=1 Tax=Peltaster fructicola TaxID=286661 RepID=A0A6H0Y188_9PEZI|nr:hypothetical protein AMS68_006146 [Peltaster fructicola]
MPPRKRARVSEAASPTQKTPEPPIKPTDEELLNDPWTDEEEIGLFKGLIKWKPTGIHKHFRMLQLREYLLENKYIHPRSVHTQIPGIWQKLESLYDLEALDQREDARQLSDLSEDQDDDEEEASDDVYSLAANKIHTQPFELPDQEYGDRVWKQRFPQDDEKGDDSPPAISGLNVSEQAPIKFTPSFSIEPEETATPAPRPRGRPPKGSSRAKAAPAATARRSRRQAESVATGSEAGSEAVEPEEAEDDAEEDDNERDDEDEGDDDDEEASQASVPTTRGRGRGSGRGAPRGRPRGRRR